MTSYASFLLLLMSHLVTAHFELQYPPWRADTLTNDSYSQWNYPCGGVPDSSDVNVTAWPMTGGSLKLDLHHPWTYIFVNLGLGMNVTNFNYTLTIPFWNETGSGILCVENMSMPSDLTPSDGQRASIQVVTVGEAGDALYNCADIVFQSNATNLNSSECITDAGVSYSPVNQEVNGSTITTAPSTGGSNSSHSSPSSTSGASAGESFRLETVVLACVVGVVSMVVSGMDL